MNTFQTHLKSRRRMRFFRYYWRQIGVVKFTWGWFGHHGGHHGQNHKRCLWTEAPVIFNL
jgi:hypothetical protein